MKLTRLKKQLVKGTTFNTPVSSQNFTFFYKTQYFCEKFILTFCVACSKIVKVLRQKNIKEVRVVSTRVIPKKQIHIPNVSVSPRITQFAKNNVVMLVALFAAAVTSIIVPPDSEYLGYFDFKTLSCLYCVLAIFGLCFRFLRLQKYAKNVIEM